MHGASGDRSRTITLGNETWTADVVAIILLREILSDALTRPGGWTAQSHDAALLEALARPADDDGPIETPAKECYARAAEPSA